MPSYALRREPVVRIEDVLAVVPSFLRPDDDAPVRDAILAAILALCLSCQDWAQWASDQASALAANGAYLDAAGEEQGQIRNGDLDPAYRARILAPPSVVAPTALLTAANAVLAPYTAVGCKYAESQDDRLFWRLEDGSTTGPFGYLYFDGSVPQSPDYADRYYESEAAQNGGVGYPGREPGSGLLFDDTVGRWFLLRAPDLTSIDGEDTPVYDTPQPNDFYVGTTAAGSFTSYVLADAATSSAIYGALINVIDRLKGQSIRWSLVVDPNLTS
ncbi:MAG TPA: hypothetical protein VGI39_03155 [Polyangiaceae bacterium]|jgi:hypothetical protein